MRKTKPYKGISLEGLLARWYAKSTARALPEFRRLAQRLASDLKPDAVVLEIAPGPGYLAIELARLGPFRITGLDISRSFVRIARGNAEEAGVTVDFRHGNASAMPFAADWFDLVVCRAAFKNFADPEGAIREMRRVLRPGGKAMIFDMRRDASDEAIAREVAKMGLGGLDAYFTRLSLRQLRRRAYSREDFQRLAGPCEISEDGIGFTATLRK